MKAWRPGARCSWRRTAIGLLILGALALLGLLIPMTVLGSPGRGGVGGNSTLNQDGLPVDGQGTDPLPGAPLPQTVANPGSASSSIP